jgi:hypothetical protein
MAEVPTSTIQPGIGTGATHLRTQNTPTSQYGSDINRLAGFGDRESSARSPLQSPEVSGNVIMGLAPTLANTYNILPPDRQNDIFSELMTGTEHEVAFLTRHFAEVLGPWYDYVSYPTVCFDTDPS